MGDEKIRSTNSAILSISVQARSMVENSFRCCSSASRESRTLLRVPKKGQRIPFFATCHVRMTNPSYGTNATDNPMGHLSTTNVRHRAQRAYPLFHSFSLFPPSIFSRALEFLLYYPQETLLLIPTTSSLPFFGSHSHLSLCIFLLILCRKTHFIEFDEPQGVIPLLCFG